MKLVNFIVTGTPRSGTGYAAAVLNALGFECGHETYINPWRFVVGREDAVTLRGWGDASWLAVPFLKSLPQHTRVIHLVRNPAPCIRSIIATGQLRTDDDYRRYIARHTWGDENVWPINQELEAQRFWADWNQRIEDSGRVTARFQVEELSRQVIDLLSALGSKPASKDAALEAVAKIPTDVNTRRHTYPTSFCFESMEWDVRRVAEKYGYARGE